MRPRLLVSALAAQAFVSLDKALRDEVMREFVVVDPGQDLLTSSAVTNGRVLTSEDQQADAKAALRKEIAEHNAAVEARKAAKRARKARG